MKKLIFLLFVGIASLCTQAQTFGVNTTSNWQQFIPNILGGDCIEISNVSYTAQNGAAGLYSNFPGFADGILITTGTVNGVADTNNTASFGEDLHLPGDPQLDALIPGYTTYDAVILQFDFKTNTTGGVFLNYIFASEEYPEFVGSQFNDVFAFFVDGQNIALIPGTTTPVAINNLNFNLNSQFYNNNDNGTWLQYDGYTTPLVASFAADSGVTYQLKIALADAGDGIYDSGIFLSAFSMLPQTIVGEALYQGTPVEQGIAELYGFNISGADANLVDIQPIVGGQYTFTDIVPGAYIARVTPDVNLYPTAVPTYFDSAFVWTDADILGFPCEGYDLTISQRVINPGLGQVSGTLGIAKMLDNNTGIAWPKQHVLLINTETYKVHGFTTTNNNGEFAFNQIANGKYKVVVDVPGYKIDAPYTLELTDNNPSFTNLHYVVNNKTIQKATYKAQTTSLFDIQSIAPNPANNTLTMALAIAAPVPTKIMVQNAQGQTVATLHNGVLPVGNNTLSFDITNLQSGFYFVQMQVNETLKTVRFVKQ